MRDVAASNDRLRHFHTTAASANVVASMLPHAYQRWIGDWLATEIPEEELATCDRCAMAAPPGTPQTTSAMAGYYGASK